MDDNREFKINLHADDPDDDLNSTVAFVKHTKPKPSAKVKKAPFLFIILAFIAFGGILAFFYYHLNNKILAINTRGSTGISTLSNEINDRFSDISHQFYIQQETTGAFLADLEAQLKKLNSSISAIQAGKLDKKDLKEAINGIQKDVAPLTESIKAINGHIARINEETQIITKNLDKVQTGVLNNKKEISTLYATHIDRVYFVQELKKEREFNQQNMAHASETLFSEISTLHQRIKEMEKKLGEITESSSKKTNTKLPSEIIYTPKPGEIIEQEIK
jgi:prefoldin subunit 5